MTEIRAGGQTLHVRRIGRGRRLLLFHGGPGLDHHLLLPLALPLARSWEVWLPDLPGHGRSQTGDGDLPSLSSLLERTSRWIEALEPAPGVIGGHSLGAWLAREMLRRGRLPVRAAVLISPPSGVAPARRSPPGPTAVARRERSLREELLAFCTEDASIEPSPELVEAVALARVRGPEAYVALRGELRRILSGPIPPCRPGCPVLVLCGEKDRIDPPAVVSRLVQVTGSSRLEVLPGAGHVPFAGDAAGVVAAIERFLASCGLSGPGSAPG